MTIYIINFGLIALYWLISREFTKDEQSYKKAVGFFMTLICIQMIFIVGLRGISVGIDTHSYERRFHLYRTMSMQEIFDNKFQEVGYSLLIKFVGGFTDSFTLFTLFVAAMSIIPIIYTITKCSKKPFLSIMLFIVFDYYAFMFSGMRQGIAYGLCVLSFMFIKNKKFIGFFGIVLLAAQFHKSAYLFLPAYFVAHMKVKRNTIFMLLTMLCFVVIFKEKLYDIIENTMYDTLSNAYEKEKTDAFLWPVMIFFTSIIMFAFKDNSIALDENYSCYVMLVGLGMVLLPFMTIGSNARRIIQYYCVFLTFAIPGIIAGIRDVKVRRIVSVAVAMGVCGMFWWSLNADGYNIIPYTVFET